MTLTPVKPSDPFDFPKSMVPLGLTYQWSASTICGEVNPQHRKLLDSGWLPVPPQWHAPYPVYVKGNVFLCHAKAKDEEAERIAGAQRNIENWAKKAGGGFSGGFRVVTQDQRGASARVEHHIGDPALAKCVVDTTMPIATSPPSACIEASPPALPTLHKTRVPRAAWLRRLFDLISMEIES